MSGSDVILSHRFDFENAESVGVVIRRVDAGYSFWWTDLIANEYEETFTDLSVCFARLSVLVACGSQEWEPSFAQDTDGFVGVAYDFILAALHDFDLGGVAS
jgi:hypothetical protein